MTTPPPPGPRRPVRIGNASGFYGDRLAAAREMVEGGDLDVLTGDYLAELTLYLLHKARLKNPDAGYATTFLTQLEAVLGTCLDRGIKVVSNAGGLNPGGLARQVRALAGRLGLDVAVAHVDGDDLVDALPGLLDAGHPLAHLDTGQPLAAAGVRPVTANAYLGGWPVAAALGAGADVVVTGRVTDASLVVGPAAWWHGWGPDDLDALAGATAAGHVVECGAQVTGGNYAFFSEVTDRRYPGFPVAEVAADGSTVVTKHPGTGGLVSVGTVTAQLLYETAEPAYAGPDVTTWFDTLRVEQAGPDRVRLSGARGTPPTGQVKVALNYTGGYRNTMTMVLTGLDLEAKAARAQELLFDLLGGRDSFDAVDVRLLRSDHPDARTQAEATAHLVVTVKDADPVAVGRRFSSTVLELTLASYPGFHTTTPPTRESAYGVYWPALVPAAAVPARVVLPDGAVLTVPAVPGDPVAAGRHPASAGRDPLPPPGGPTALVPLGRVAGARSGDKGGNANVGFWTRTGAEHAWLDAFLTVEQLRALLPEADGLEVRRYRLPGLRALNFVVVGLLGEGVASSTRPDPQAKALGEFLRSRLVPVPVALLDGSAGGPGA
ncbi:MAG: Terpene utilization protein AtuA [uncultured Friedmanniella sp.]|uniref:Terpene utilization protein AtuA n=1 Tax=uncultured Friedmanniella sp. TaxID=335381 RepID=A0A6J4KXZ9_9ACTN|nr:MAG: Terpene utilization protein AtuA [uncultured Friedmanniella sp.]